MTTARFPEPEWFKWATGQPPTVLDLWDGAPSLFLAPTTRGAILWWQFDLGEDGSDYILLAHLTDAEAQAVFESRTTAGALEAVRAHIQDDRAVIARRHPPSGYESVHMFHMPRHYTENQFADWLDGIAEVLGSEGIPQPARKYEVFIGHARKPSEERDPTAEAIDRIAATVVPA